MGILDDIVFRKKEALNKVRSRQPVSELKHRIRENEKPRDFMSAVMRSPGGPVKLIAEIKKASPSKGVIRRDFDHLSIAGIYEKKAVDAVSVLTEEHFFQGNLSFLSDTRKVYSGPVLRKDFLFNEYQIYESRAHGADAILLIAAILDKNQAKEYLHLAAELGLSVLFEIHDYRELETALSTDCKIIGINNRNLKTLAIDINTTFMLKKEIPSHKIVVAESGIKTREDVRTLGEAGIDAMLVGTSFMESRDIAGMIDLLTGKTAQI
ncbi:MAG: indole-3-glycerol phosphate synthase TrpC [Nitrospirota bacterium]